MTFMPMERPKDKGEVHNRVVSCWVLWTDLTKSSLVRLSECRFHMCREVELAKYGLSDDREGCCVAPVRR